MCVCVRLSTFLWFCQAFLCPLFIPRLDVSTFSHWLTVKKLQEKMLKKKKRSSQNVPKLFWLFVLISWHRVSNTKMSWFDRIDWFSVVFFCCSNDFDFLLSTLGRLSSPQSLLKKSGQTPVVHHCCYIHFSANCRLVQLLGRVRQLAGYYWSILATSELDLIFKRSINEIAREIRSNWTDRHENTRPDCRNFSKITKIRGFHQNLLAVDR